MKILIFGLPGSGKTTLAKRLSDIIECDWYNADVIRQEYNDWDFSKEGRIRQSNRMQELSNYSTKPYVICDFVAPTEEIRNRFNSDISIWMNTISSSRYEDTNNVFQIPTKVDLEINNFDYNIKDILNKLI